MIARTGSVRTNQIVGQMINSNRINHVTKERLGLICLQQVAVAGELRCVDSTIASVTDDIDSAFILKSSAEEPQQLPESTVALYGGAR